jgi:anti-anti-sigma regulatory factor
LLVRMRGLSDRLQQSNEQLESEVAARTEALASELAERKRAESARASLHEEMLAVQRARLAELSTPLLPIAEGIVVMPLIGTIDQERADQVLETALAGVSERHARWLILDITGVKIVDTSVASTLMSTASAVRLLGADVVITGVRAAVAQTLVDLGAPLAGLVTRTTLANGIAHAATRLRGASGPRH